MKISKINFTADFIKNYGESMPNYIETIYLNKNKIFSKDKPNVNLDTDVISINLINPFFKCKLRNEDTYTKKIIPHYGAKGVGIMLDKPYTLDNYLSKFTKRQLRVNLKKAVMRLEKECNISYEYNYGSITKKKYDFLINAHKEFIKKRFDTKKIENYFLNDCENNTNNLFTFINDKKASLFVMYDNKKPIGISLNRHINNSYFFSESHSYDINYSKYSLGHIDNKIIIEWCINNNYLFIDLGIGAFDYKKKWCNTTYNLEYQIYYKTNSAKAAIRAKLEVLKILIKNFTKKSIDKVLRRKTLKPSLISN